MDKRLAQVLDGSVGLFWPITTSGIDLEAEPSPGSITRAGDEATLQLIADDLDPAVRLSRPVARGFVGATAGSGVLILDLTSVRGTSAFGGGRISTQTFTGETVILERELVTVDSPLVSSITIRFLGDRWLRWAGLEVMTLKTTTDARQRVQRVDIALEAAPDLSVTIKGHTLTISAHWVTQSPGQSGSHLIDTSLSAELRSAKPVPISKLLGPLSYVQGLLGIAFRGYPPASNGMALRAGAAEADAMWNAALMSDRPHTDQPDASPLFSIDVIGGVAGLRRWVGLCVDHPRVVAPLLSRMRDGRRSVEVETLELATAIEYWVAAHRRTNSKWTRKGDNFASALALNVGHTFDTWSGGGAAWAKLFWEHYNGLKHDPKHVYSQRELAVLVEAGRLLLVAALLNRTAGTKRPTEFLFADYRHRQLGESVAQLTGSSPT